MIIQPLIAVRGVQASSRWYQQVLGLESGHGGDQYEQLMYQGDLLLQLHDWDLQEHAHLGDPQRKPYGNGVLLWFETDRFDQAIERVRSQQVHIVEQPHVNPLAQHRECWIEDPDGYLVVLASPYGDVG